MDLKGWYSPSLSMSVLLGMLWLLGCVMLYCYWGKLDAKANCFSSPQGGYTTLPVTLHFQHAPGTSEAQSNRNKPYPFWAGGQRIALQLCCSFWGALSTSKQCETKPVLFFSLERVTVSGDHNCGTGLGYCRRGGWDTCQAIFLFFSGSTGVIPVLTGNTYSYIPLPLSVLMLSVGWSSIRVSDRSFQSYTISLMTTVKQWLYDIPL